MDRYSHTLNKLFNLPKKDVWSLSNLQQISKIYNHPEKRFKTIHVAGTNGKGSVSTKIARALEYGGYRAGLFTSPHLIDIRERIQINSEMISKKDLQDILEDLYRTAQKESITLSFFEMITAAAFLYFEKQKIDIAVIETGIGGRLDATNIISPILSVITSIGFDHKEMLGDSLEKIAMEKGGIIKPNTPVVLGWDLPLAVFQQIAQKQNSPLFQNIESSTDFEQDNQNTAALSLRILKISPQAIEQGLKAKPPCRFQLIEKEKKIILDVAHNPHGIARLLEKLEKTYPGHHYHFILSFSKDKDIEGIMRLIETRAASIHLPHIAHPRLAKPSEIQQHTTHSNIICWPDVPSAVQHALQMPHIIPEVIVVTGSFFLLEKMRALY